MKRSKLTKSNKSTKSSKSSYSAKSKPNGTFDPQIDHEDSTFRTSIDDLKNRPNRQQLKQHFTGAFPETQMRPSMELDEAIIHTDMPGRGKLSRTTSNVAESKSSMGLSSPSSTSLTSTDAHRLATLREGNASIDIAEVIGLLQELRKTASPAELVALHKALLPTRDSVIPSPAMSSSECETAPISRPSFVRRRSLLPPGIRTRNATGDEVSRPKSATWKSNRRRPHTQPAPNTDPASLDLVNDSLDLGKFRSSTPVDHEVVQMGAYGPGTLRITNGTASPEPGIARRSVELESQVQEKQRPLEEFKTAPSTPYNEPTKLLQASQATEPSHESTQASDKQQKQPADIVPQLPSSEQLAADLDASRRASEPTVSSTPTVLKDTSSHGLGKAKELEDLSKLQGRSQERSHSSLAYFRSTEESYSLHKPGRAPIEGPERSSSQQSMRNDKVSSFGPYALRSSEGSTQERPRFAQRWSHRLTHISQEQGTEERPHSNPFENHAALRRLSQRVSTVTDRTERSQEDAEATTPETPEAALAKLTGERDQKVLEATREPATAGPNEDTPTSTEACQASNEHPFRPKKTDSGYGSDNAHIRLERKEGGDADTVLKMANLPRENVAEQTHKAYEGLLMGADEVSLYSFEQVLKSPYLLCGLANPTPPSARGSKKHLSLLGLNKPKGFSAAQGATAEQVDSESLPGAEKSNSKQPHKQKKLQKSMPGSFRNSIRIDKRKKSENRGSRNVIMFPDITDDLEDMFSSPSDRGAFTNTTNQLSFSDMLILSHADEPPGVGRDEQPFDIPHDPRLKISTATPDVEPTPSGNVSRRPTVKDSSNRELATAATAATSATLDLVSGRNSKESRSPSPRASHSDVAKISLQNHDADTQYETSDRNYIGPMVKRTDQATSPTEPNDNQLERPSLVPGATLYECRVDHHYKTNTARSKYDTTTGIEDTRTSDVAHVSSRDTPEQNSRASLDREARAPSKSRLSKRFSIQRRLRQQGAEGNNNIRKEGRSSAAKPSSDDVNLTHRSSKPVAQHQLPKSTSTPVQRLDTTAAEQSTSGMQSNNKASSNASEGPPGDSTESIADVVKRTVQARKAKETAQMQQSHGKHGSHAVENRKSKSKRDSTRFRSDQLNGSSSEDLNSQPAHEQPPPSPTSDKAEKPDWEQYEKGWRQRRESLGRALGKTALVESAVKQSSLVDRSSTSPAIIFSAPTPPAVEVSTNPFDSEHQSSYAELQARQYQDLLDESAVSEDDNSEPGRDVSILGQVNAVESLTQEVHIDDSYSWKPYYSDAPQIERSRSPGGRVVTRSGNFHPYAPSKGEGADTAHAESLARLTGSSVTAERTSAVSA